MQSQTGSGVRRIADTNYLHAEGQGGPMFASHAVLVAGALVSAFTQSDAFATCAQFHDWEQTSVLGLGTIHRFDYDPTHVRLAVASDRGIVIWNVESEQVERILTGHSDIVKNVSWSPDGSMIASDSNDATIRVWDAQSGALIRVILESYGGLSSAAGSKQISVAPSS